MSVTMFITACKVQQDGCTIDGDETPTLLIHCNHHNMEVNAKQVNFSLNFLCRTYFHMIIFTVADRTLPLCFASTALTVTLFIKPYVVYDCAYTIDGAAVKRLVSVSPAIGQSIQDETFGQKVLYQMNHHIVMLIVVGERLTVCVAGTVTSLAVFNERSPRQRTGHAVDGSGASNLLLYCKHYHMVVNSTQNF